jgi:hypothetical protein
MITVTELNAFEHMEERGRPLERNFHLIYYPNPDMEQLAIA